jgi:hypothetical protein
MPRPRWLARRTPAAGNFTVCGTGRGGGRAGYLLNPDGHVLALTAATRLAQATDRAVSPGWSKRCHQGRRRGTGQPFPPGAPRAGCQTPWPWQGPVATPADTSPMPPAARVPRNVESSLVQLWTPSGGLACSTTHAATLAWPAIMCQSLRPGVTGGPSERRSNDGQVILEAPSAAWKPGPDLLVCEPPYGIEP